MLIDHKRQVIVSSDKSVHFKESVQLLVAEVINKTERDKMSIFNSSHISVKFRHNKIQWKMDFRDLSQSILIGYHSVRNGLKSLES